MAQIDIPICCDLDLENIWFVVPGSTHLPFFKFYWNPWYNFSSDPADRQNKGWKRKLGYISVLSVFWLKSTLVPCVSCQNIAGGLRRQQPEVVWYGEW